MNLTSLKLFFSKIILLNLIVILGLSSTCNLNENNNSNNPIYANDSITTEIPSSASILINGKIKSGKISKHLTNSFREVILQPYSAGKISSFEFVYTSNKNNAVTIKNEGYVFNKTILDILQRSDSGDVFILINIIASNGKSNFYLSPVLFEVIN